MPKELPKPLKKQREVLYMPAKGHFAVLGTAGSGKTTLALYRAAYLAGSEMPHGGRTLLLTFNKALVTYLKYLKPIELRNVYIENYHTFARGYLNARGKMSYNCICSDSDERRGYITQALKNIEANHAPSKFLKRPIQFFMDEIEWILSHGIAAVDDYVKVERVGRIGTNLSRRLRPVMFEVLEEYLKIRNKHGKLYDWDDIALHVRKEFDQDAGARHYKHIIVDEGQDFSPEMIRSLSSAIPENGSLTFFGDVAQQIFGQRMSWREAGLKIPQVWRFKENYRNTKQISQLGLAVSQMPFFEGIADLVEPTSPRADGPLPTIAKCKDDNQQVDIALNVARNAASTQSVAILIKNRSQEKIFSSRLGREAIRLHRDLQTWKDGPGIFHGTYHSAKGLEFDMVILPFLDADNLPDQERISSQGEEDALTHDGRLLYVALTRAKTNLVLLYKGEITPLLPTDKFLYQEVSAMNPIQQECNRREITRLCHFTQSRNMAHIFDDPYGLYSTKTLRDNDMPHNPTDSSRYDGRDDLVCCSIEYPNTYYFANVRDNDRLFKDWVVLFIDHSHLWQVGTNFCPCNAARERGRYIQEGIAGFQSLFAETSPGIGFTRSERHLPAAPTDIQAEVLVRDPIPLQSITGVAVRNEEQALRELCRLKLQGISLGTPIYVAPEFYNRATLSRSIQNGIRITETLYNNGGRHGR